MKAHELTLSLQKLIAQKVPVFLWGAPGIGKSSIVKQIALQEGVGFIDLRLALMDPTDLKGIPFYDKESHTALWAPPAFLPKDGQGVLFLDELNSAAPAVQSSAYQLILDRRIGEYELPEGWAIVAAGNREGDRGVTYRMPAPLANRFVHFELEVSVEDWKRWAYKNGIHPSIIAYISYKNEHLFGFDPKADAKAFATPRSWEYVNKVLSASIEQDVLLETLSGTIGKEIAVSFLSFLRVESRLPDVEKILAGEDIYSDEVDVLYVLSSVLVSRALQDESVLERVIEYTLGLKGEFAVLIVQDLQKNGVQMEHIKAFHKWVEQFSYLLV